MRSDRRRSNGIAEAPAVEQHLAEVLDVRGTRVGLVGERPVDRACQVGRDLRTQVAHGRKAEGRKFLGVAPGQDVMQVAPSE